MPSKCDGHYLSDKQKNLLILGIMLILLAVSIFIIYPPGEKTKLGLDLQGGLEVILEAQGDVTSEQMDQVGTGRPQPRRQAGRFRACHQPPGNEPDLGRPGRRQERR